MRQYETIITDINYPDNFEHVLRIYSESKGNWYRISNHRYEVIDYISCFQNSFSKRAIQIFVTIFMEGLTVEEGMKRFKLSETTLYSYFHQCLHACIDIHRFLDEYRERGKDILLCRIDSHLAERVYNLNSYDKSLKEITYRKFEENYLEYGLFDQPSRHSRRLAWELCNPEKRRKLRYIMKPDHPFFEYAAQELERIDKRNRR